MVMVSCYNHSNDLLFCFQCEPGLAATVMYDLLYNPPHKLMLLAGCSTVCTTVAEAAKMWNLVVVSLKYASLINLVNTVISSNLLGNR